MQSTVRGLIARAAIVPKRIYWYARRRVGETKRRRVRRSAAKGELLANQIAVVTGAANGIGLAIATAFARASAHCVLVDTDAAAGNAAVKNMRAQGFCVEFAEADVSNPAQVHQLASEIAKKHGRVDILVNNAGVQLEGDRRMHASAMDAEIMRRTLDVNLYGAINACAAFAPLLPVGGRIINVSSVMGQLSQPSDGYVPAYRVSKAALNSYTQSLAADLAPRGVMVDCLHPGWVKTALGGPNAKIDPDEATDTAFFLATRRSSDDTGLFWWDCQTIRW